MSEMTTVEPAALQTGICVVCRGTLRDHFNASNAWIGCHRTPRARGSQVMFIPFIPVTPEALGAVIAQEPAATFKEAAKRREARPKEQKVATASTPKTTASEGHRGRAAGKYFATETEPKKVVTESVMAVYKLLKGHKRGLTAKDVAARLEMPLGTVGWAIRWLVKQSAANYQPAAAAAA